MRKIIPVGLLMVAVVTAAAESARTSQRSGRLPIAKPADVGMSAGHLKRIDSVVEKGLSENRMPGCVVAVGRRGSVVYLKAFGFRQTVPKRVKMTTDTLFDLASLTKPIATTTSVMRLVEQGKVRLHDRVQKYIPEFGQNGKERVTIYHLLTHQSGLTPDNALGDYLDGPAKAWERIFALGLRAEPGSKFIYTDVGFLVLAELVRRVSGQDINEFSRDHIFQPLGMASSGYLPSEALSRRAAVTQKRNGRWMQGEVHDPRAFHLGGVAGHAGLFSTADDLSRFAQMMLNGGQSGGVQILAPRTVEVTTAPYPVDGGVRGLGWDKRTGYSSNRGELFSARAFGHGGFTGTAMWIDPELQLFVIFLSNRVHPDGKGSVNALAGRIGTIAGAAVRDLSTTSTAQVSSRSGGVLCGVDVLQRDGYKQLDGKRVGLITNQTGVNKEGVSTARLLADAPNVKLAALFSPEHGIEGKLDVATIADSRHDATGIKVFSLYGESRRPSAESLQDLDALVFDIQDIGTRFYTYISTLGYAMQTAAQHNVPVVVLDRPNPISGRVVSGPVLDPGRESFVGFHPIPVRHGMTAGELAHLFHFELKLSLELTVIPVERWRRNDFFDQTGLFWINPSPNMRSLTQALLYPGIGLLETTNLSVGRGTDTPFELFGAPWIDGRRLAGRLNAVGLPGVRFIPLRFTPNASKFAGELCGGVSILVTRRAAFESLRTGLEVARQLRLLYPQQWEMEAYDRLLGSQSTWQAVRDGRSVEEMQRGYRSELSRFMIRRAAWLLYD